MLWIEFKMDLMNLWYIFVELSVMFVNLWWMFLNWWWVFVDVWWRLRLWGEGLRTFGECLCVVKACELDDECVLNVRCIGWHSWWMCMNFWCITKMLGCECTHINQTASTTHCVFIKASDTQAPQFSNMIAHIQTMHTFKHWLTNLCRTHSPAQHTSPLKFRVPSPQLAVTTAGCSHSLASMDSNFTERKCADFQVSCR